MPQQLIANVTFGIEHAPTPMLIDELMQRMLTTRQLVDELLIRLGFDPGIVVSGTIDFDNDRTLTAMVVKREVVDDRR